jgi:CheY-like chemotaxis protein
LQGLLKQFSLKASNATPSGMRTAAAALDLLEILCKNPSRPDLATVPPVRMLAVDDDAITRRAVSLCLKKAFNEPDVAPEGRTALALAEQQSYDIIFLDIEMPGMDGLELCARIHETAQNRSTPVVFVTSHTDFESRAKSAMLGAQDLIGKPFLTFEITVKALTVVLKARQAYEAKGASSDNPTKKADSFVAVGREVVGGANRLPTQPVPEPSGQPA